MLSAIDHVVLKVVDVDRSIAWYQEHFGVSVERLDDWRSGSSPFVSLRLTPELIIDLLPGAPTGNNVDHVAFVTGRDEFEGFVSTFEAEIEMGPMQLSGARGQGEGVYLRDPDGHRLELRTYS